MRVSDEALAKTRTLESRKGAAPENLYSQAKQPGQVQERLQ